MLFEAKALKISKLLTFLALLLLLVVTPVAAFDLSPDSGSIAVGLNQNLQVIAKPPAGNWNGVEIRISLVGGMTITNFTPAAGFTPSYPCGEVNEFTANSICVSLTRPTVITNNLNLGTIAVSTTTEGSAIFSVEVNSMYFNALNDSNVSTGSIANFTVTPEGSGSDLTSSGGLPNTALFDGSDSSNRALLSFGLIILGLLSFSVIPHVFNAATLKLSSIDKSLQSIDRKRELETYEKKVSIDIDRQL